MTLPHPLPDDLVELIARRFRVLGEPMRIKLLDRLREGEASVNELSRGARRLATERLQAPRGPGRGRHPRPPQGRNLRLLPDRRRGRLRALRAGLRLGAAAAARAQRARRRRESLDAQAGAVGAMTAPQRHRLPACGRAPRSGRADRPPRPLDGRPRPRRRDRLGHCRARARRLRAEGRDRFVRRRLAGQRLRVGAGAPADPDQLRRAFQLGADGRRPLAEADRLRRRAFGRPSPASRRSFARTHRSRRCSRRARARASPRTDTPPSSWPAPRATRRQWSPPSTRSNRSSRPPARPT